MTEHEPITTRSRVSLDAAVAAARAGRRDEATRMLQQIVESDPFNADAWVWLGGVASDPREQRSALEQALTIAPDNQRAQHGLEWLRQNRPEAFDDTNARIYEAPPITGSTAQVDTVQPRTDRSTPSYEQRAVVPTEHVAATYEEQSEASDQDRTVAMPTYYAQAEQPTLAMPAYQTQAAASQTDRMAVAPRPATGGYTDRMPVAPPAQSEPVVVEQRSTGANVARWLLVLIWLLSFGAIATLAALTFIDPATFQQTVNGLLAPYGFQLDPAMLNTTRLTTAGVLTAIAVVDLIMVFGLLARGRWAWVVNLLIALAVTAGTVALWVLAATSIPAVSAFNVQNPIMIALLSLSGFTLVYLFLSIASRRAFFPRRVVQDQDYERQ